MRIQPLIAWSLTLCLAAGLVGCKSRLLDNVKTVWTVRHRDDLRTIQYRIPALESQECRSALLNALKGVAGILEATPNVSVMELEIQYNSLIVESKNIEYALTEAGFDVNDSAGNPAAKEKLPDACR